MCDRIDESQTIAVHAIGRYDLDEARREKSAHKEQSEWARETQRRQ